MPDKETAPDAVIREFVARSGLVPGDPSTHFTALTGGVASDIWKVEAARAGLRREESIVAAARRPRMDGTGLAQRERSGLAGNGRSSCAGRGPQGLGA